MSISYDFIVRNPAAYVKQEKHFCCKKSGHWLYSAWMGKKVRFVIDVTEAGRKGGAATAANRTAAERQEAARKAIQARWEKYYAEHPEKRKTARTAASRKKRS